MMSAASGDNKTILVTGGAGFIGSHTVIELLNAGYDPVVIDNGVNCCLNPSGDKAVSICKVEEITGKKVKFHNVDTTDLTALRDLFSKYNFTAVIHLAGLKAVGESVEKPVMYYRDNVVGTISLIDAMREYGVKDIVFSSSATVYGDPSYLPLDEKHPVGGCTNPYGKTKYFIEEILKDLWKSDNSWNIVLLRYFNPVGAHESGKIGEDPKGIPNNLMPYVSQVAVGKRPHLNVFGDDYDTPDGTGVRDYIHVVDLAVGHVSALTKIAETCGLKVYNLGTGNGYSVLDMVSGMEKAAGVKIAYKVVGRREGDVGSVYADCSLADQELGWTAKKDLAKMCEDLWKWQTQNPSGFQEI